MESPVKSDFRMARRTTTLAGVDVAAGTTVMMLNGAANRDHTPLRMPAGVPGRPRERPSAHRARPRHPPVPGCAARPGRPASVWADLRPHRRHPHLRGRARVRGYAVATTTNRRTSCAASAALHLEFTRSTTQTARLERHGERFRRHRLLHRRVLVADPVPHFDHLRERCPVQREQQRNVMMVTGYDEAIAVYHDTASFSSCNSVSGPFPGFPVELEGDDVSAATDRAAPRGPADERPAPDVRSAEAHGPPRATHATDHAEAPQGERGVHVAARRSPDRRVRRSRRVRVHHRVRGPVHPVRDRRSSSASPSPTTRRS